MKQRTEEKLPTGFIFTDETPRICRCLFRPQCPTRLIKADVKVQASTPIQIPAKGFDLSGEPIAVKFKPLAPELHVTRFCLGSRVLVSDVSLADFIEGSISIFSAGPASAIPGMEILLELELKTQLRPGEAVTVQPIYTVSNIR
jgi:hypothetical protein